MSQSRGTHLGDGAYIVPDPDGMDQLWLSVNHHENRVIALDATAFMQMAHWVRQNAPPAYARAMALGLGITMGEV